MKLVIYQRKKLKREENVISINFLQLKLAPTFEKFGAENRRSQILRTFTSSIIGDNGVSRRDLAFFFLLHFFEFLPQRSKRIIKVYCRRCVMTGSGLAELTVWISETFRHSTDFRSRNYTSIKPKYSIFTKFYAVFSVSDLIINLIPYYYFWHLQSRKD